MKNFSRNTTAVLVVTLFTGLAVFTAIQLGGRLFGTSTASAQTVTTQSAQTQSGSGSQGYTDPYGQSSRARPAARPTPTRTARAGRAQARARARARFELRPDVHLPGDRVHGVDVSRHAVTE